MLFDKPHPRRGDALIIMDIQNDFLSGGKLPVSDGDDIIPLINDYIDIFLTRELPIFATRNWYPNDHYSFQAQGGPWPPHCIAGSPGAEFAPGLRLPDPEKFTIITKNTDPAKNAYSGFDGTDLAERLRQESIQRIFVAGLATDYGVLNTVQDALKMEFKVILLEDAIRAMNIQPDDGSKAVDEMHQQGAKPATRDKVMG